MKAIGKRALSLLLSILLAAGCCVVAGLSRPTIKAETFTSGDYEYTLLEDGTAQITDYTGSDTDLTILVQLDGHPVTGIGERAFSDQRTLVHVSIPEGVVSIGESAFEYCTELTGVDIPDSVTSIGEAAFYVCSSLTGVTLPASLTNLGGWAFYDCYNLAGSVTIPEGITSIQARTFSGCNQLTGVVLPNSITSIGGYAFDYCGLEQLNLPEQLSSIGDSAFEGCRELEEVILPEGLTSIGFSSFARCDSLARIIIPDSLSTIEAYAFAYASNLMEVTLPAQVTLIRYNAFFECPNLADVYYAGTPAQWNQMEVESKNEDLLNAAIHYGGNPSGDTITSFVSLEQDTGKQMFLSASGRNLSEDQVTLTSRDEGVVSAQLQSVQVVSSAGENPLQTLVVSVYLTANGLGQAQVQVSYPGGQQIIQVTVTESQAPEVPADFDEATYHADHLLDTTTPGNWSMEDTLGYLTSPLGTPSRIFLTGLEDGLFEEAVLAWEGLDDLSLAVNDPTGLMDKEVKVQDLYSAMILQSLRASFEIGLADSMADSLSTQQSVLGQITNLLQTKYNIKMLGNKMDPSTYAGLSLELKMEINEDIQQTFAENYPLTAATDVFKGFNLGIEVFDTVEDYVEYIYNGATLIALSDSAKAALQEMYRQCPASNYTLKLALQDCIQIMNSGTEEFLLDAAARSMQSVGWQTAKYLVGELWGTVMDLAQKTLPGVGYLVLAYDGAKLLTNGLFNTDATITSYYKMRIMTELEEVSSAAYRSLASQYRQSGSAVDAQTLLSCGEILFQIMDSDCVEADGFVGALDEAGITSIAKLFGCENNYDAVRASIEEIRKSNDLNRYTAATNWIYYLEEDYPDSGMYEAYSYRFDQEQQKMVGKEYRVACPVDVMVYDSSTGELAASVVDGRIQNNVPEDLTLILQGEEKVLRTVSGTEYRIVLVGSGTGTMDITVREFDAKETAVRTVSYDNVALTDGKTYETTLDSQTMVQDSYILTDRTDGGVVAKTQDTLDFEGKTYTLQVNFGLATVDGKQGTTLEVAPGQLVTVTAYVPEGVSFHSWQINQGSGVLADPGAVSTTFRMPAEDVTLTAGVGQNPSDVNEDSQVDVADVMSLAQQIVNGSTSTQYDFNQDGILDVLDVMTLAQQIVNQTV